MDWVTQKESFPFKIPEIEHQCDEFLAREFFHAQSRHLFFHRGPATGHDNCRTLLTGIKIIGEKFFSLGLINTQQLFQIN